MRKRIRRSGADEREKNREGAGWSDRSRATLRESEARFREALAASRQVIYRFDHGRDRYDYLAPIAEQVFGVSLEELTRGRGVDRILADYHPEDRERARETIRRLLTREIPSPADYEYRRRMPDGSFRWFRTWISTTFGRSGRPLFSTGSIIDISLRKQAEEQLREALARERELVDLKGRFVSTVSHELRAPLAAIRLALDLLERHGETMPPDRLRKHRGIMRRGLDEMENLLEQVLACSRFDLKGPGGTEPVRPGTLLRERARRVGELGTGERFRVETDPSLEVPYLLNRQVLEQSLDNLLINAAKYSSPEDPIRIRGTFEPSLISCEDPRRGIGFLQVRVRDFGIGVPEADRPRLFEPFHRGSNVGTIRGTGLGLALVRAWVEGAGGIVGYETPSGGGSIFRIDLPAIPERGKTEARLVRTGLLGVAEKTGVE